MSLKLIFNGVVAAVCIGWGACAFCAGPSEVAISNHALWPDKIDTPAEFDKASRAEILVFASVLSQVNNESETSIKERLHLKNINGDSIKNVEDQLWERLDKNYTLAAANCQKGIPFCSDEPINLQHDALETVKSTNSDGHYDLWLNDALKFHKVYLDELLRLAALFPHPSSEIQTFNKNELTGDELPDRTFLLTFDDGPTSGKNDQDNETNTDRTLDVLRAENINAVFFSLGAMFEAREKYSSKEALQKLYAGMCVGSHGWLHNSHATWSLWQESVENSTKLLQETIPDSYLPLFRPPYGQRREDSGAYFEAKGLRVVLWNIDSQDWNNNVSAEAAEQRVTSLILLWRHGIILFHDVHPKAQIAVPQLIDWAGHSDVVWMDCHHL